MGAAGTALAATMPRDRLTRMFTPLLFVLAALGLRYWIESPLEALLAPPGAGTGDERWHRHESPLYWFDADWLPAVMALVGVCAFDLFDRSRHDPRRWIDQRLMLVPFAAAGSALGYLVQRVLQMAAWEDKVRQLLVVKLGDLNYINPQTQRGFDPDQLLTNWPQFFSDYHAHLGWGWGLLLGAAAYFIVTGRFRRDASLFLYLSLGWLLAFLAMPVLGSIALMDYGGLRVMPPRSDDWAGILGVFLGGLLWARRHDLDGVAHVMARGFILGGIAFASVQMIRYLLRYPGHPWRYPEGVPEALAHYQSANWHSIMEQMHGFGHGIAIAVAMGMLWRRQAWQPDGPCEGHWTATFSVLFAFFGVGYLNLHKLVETWVDHGAVPAMLKAPLIEPIEAAPLAWFRVVWWTAAGVALLLLALHRRRRLEIVPVSWTGKGQLLFVLFLWMLVIGNLMRAIPGFQDNRMVTEWLLFMNASLATLLIVALPRPSRTSAPDSPMVEWRPLGRTWIGGLLAASLLMCAYAFLTLWLYQKDLEGKPWANHRRFGPDAKWRIDPILKQGEHP
jgi:hypothetical protein